MGWLFKVLYYSVTFLAAALLLAGAGYCAWKHRDVLQEHLPQVQFGKAHAKRGSACPHDCKRGNKCGCVECPEHCKPAPVGSPPHKKDVD